MKNSHQSRWWDKWDKAAGSFDLMNRGIELRYGEVKREWFSHSQGLTLLVAAGTGLDLQYFAADRTIVGIDISMKMLEKAKAKAVISVCNSALLRADVQSLGFADNTFDSIVTSCTFCSVPDPVQGLKELKRVLKPGGRIHMFEHVRSGIFWMGPMMDLMSIVSRRFGPDLNRRTGENIVKAGFTLRREVNIYLDMVKLFEAQKIV